MLKLEMYVGESDRHGGNATWKAVLKELQRSGVAGATVTHGKAGYGAGGEIHTADVLRLSEDLPVKIEAVDTPDAVEDALDSVEPMVGQGLITTTEVRGTQKT